MECAICETIVDVSSAPFEEWDDDILGEVTSLLDGDCLHVESLQRASNFDQPLKEFPHRQLALKKENNQTAARFGLGHQTPAGDIIFDNTSSTAMELVQRNGEAAHPGRAVLPDSKWIDLDAVRSWISLCKTQHGQRCREPAWLKGVATTGPQFLIDVVDSCIVSPSKHAPYVALSYTWGLGRNLKNTKAITRDLQQPGAFHQPRFAAQLPETIRNTIDLVRCLGERYLWVDALCIIQDDPDSLSQNLNQMQLLYANATFSVMASAGCGAEFGLRGVPFVSQPRNLEMRVYELADGEKLCAKPLPTDPTGGSKFSYHQRGWTFQEWLFSRRRLVFTDGLLEWECQCAHWQEHLKPDPEVDNHWATRPRGYETKLTPSPSMWDYTPVLAQFNTKALTIAEDAPRAFAGIQAMLHRVHPGGLLFGLSEFFFDVFLAWSSLYSDVERRGSDPTAKFREGLPSWSWMGWQGDVDFPYDNEFRLTQPWHGHEQKVGFTEPTTEWYCATSPKSTRRRVRSEWHEYRSTALQDSGSMVLMPAWSRNTYVKASYPYDFVPFETENPSYIYCHESDPQQSLRYPVPILKWADTPILSEQMQYLIGRTSRVTCSIAVELRAWRVDDYPRRIRVKDERNNTAVSLTLPSAKEAAGFVDDSLRPTSLELIAFARGWSTWLGNDVVNEEQVDDHLDSDGKLAVYNRIRTGH